MNAYNLMFVILAVLIMCSSVATVVTKSIIRAATYLLFVLLGTAGLYFLLGYTFLGSVQIMVYARWYHRALRLLDSAHLGASRGTLLFAPLQDH